MADYSIKSLFHHRLRLAVSILSIGIAIALIIIIYGLADGFYKQASSYYRNNKAQIIVAENDEGILGASTFLPSKIKETIKKSDYVKSVSEIIIFRYVFRETPISFIGYQDEKDGPWELSEGRLIQKNNEIVLDKALAYEKKIKLNDFVSIYDRKLKVVGLSAETNSFISPFNFISLESLRSLSGASQMTSNFMVRAKNVKRALRSINHNLNEGKAFSINEISASEEAEVKQVMSDHINVTRLIACFISFLVISLNAYVATLSKISEFGILKAIGAKKLTLLGVVLKQTFISTVLGFIIGIGFAFLAVYIIFNLRPKFLITITWPNLVQTLVIALVLSAIAAIIPARKVNVVDPVLVFKG